MGTNDRYEARLNELISRQEGDSERVAVLRRRAEVVLKRQGFLSTEDLALFLDTNEWTVAHWCREGTVPARKVGAVWHIGLEGLFYEKKR